MILASFNSTWDWTAVGTLALAVATFVSLYFARRALAQAQQQIRLGQEQLEQTQTTLRWWWQIPHGRAKSASSCKQP
jgi:hypothetical protein